MQPMQIWGLTGGIASGKSTVAQLLVAHGVPVVDADALYHRLIAPHGGAPSDLAARVSARFGGCLLPDGSLDRRTLGARVFADAAEKAALEAITHPVVAAAAQAALEALSRKGHALSVYDIPLLYERDLARRYDGVAVVWVPRAVQVARLCARDRLEPTSAAQRIDAQLSLDDKRQRADVVLDNSQGPKQLALQVRAWLAALGALAPAAP